MDYLQHIQAMATISGGCIMLLYIDIDKWSIHNYYLLVGLSEIFPTIYICLWRCKLLKHELPDKRMHRCKQCWEVHTIFMQSGIIFQQQPSPYTACQPKVVLALLPPCPLPSPPHPALKISYKPLKKLLFILKALSNTKPVIQLMDLMM